VAITYGWRYATSKFYSIALLFTRTRSNLIQPSSFGNADLNFETLGLNLNELWNDKWDWEWE
jgi:hypothetical protein